MVRAQNKNTLAKEIAKGIETPQWDDISGRRTDAFGNCLLSQLSSLFLAPDIHSLPDAMSPSALSKLFTFAALSIAVANAQVTGTFPPTPLASKTYAYPTGIVCYLPRLVNQPRLTNKIIALHG